MAKWNLWVVQGQTMLKAERQKVGKREQGVAEFQNAKRRNTNRGARQITLATGTDLACFVGKGQCELFPS